MTLQPYDPNDLDQLALQVLDLVGTLRTMARRLRDERVDRFELNDRKALDWIDRLSVWAQKSEAELNTHINKTRGARLARKMTLPDEEE